MTLLKRELHDRFQCLPDVAAMADGVVALTPADACYWRQFSPRVFETRNPIEVEGVPLNALGGRTMLWVGAIRRKNARWMQSRRSCGLAIACGGKADHHGRRIRARGGNELAEERGVRRISSGYGGNFPAGGYFPLHKRV